MTLPNELDVAIIHSLGSRDLKSARLVSKLWCSYASGFLFQKIYVSPHKVDLEAFEAITQDSVLSKSVRKLVYDGSEFIPNYSKASYLQNLWSQGCSSLCHYDNWYPDSQDPEFCSRVSALVGKDRQGFEATIDRLEDSEFLNEGYKMYTEHAVHQHHLLQSEEFVNILTEGLWKVVLLDSIDVQDRWPMAARAFDKRCEGSPLARRWKPDHLCPASWVWKKDPMSYACAKSNGIGHYWIIVSALVRAQRQVRNLSIDSISIPPEVFDRTDHTKPSILGLDVVAFAGLESLHLSLASWCDGCGDEETPEVYPNIDGLWILLSLMT
ncbi:MAG: hypothetical protein Q9175_001235 [Cornicularia normoerica]